MTRGTPIYHCSSQDMLCQQTNLNSHKGFFLALATCPLRVRRGSLLIVITQSSKQAEQHLFKYCWLPGWLGRKDWKNDLILAIKWSGPKVTHFTSPHTSLYRISHVAPLSAKGPESSVFHVSGRQAELDIGKKH